MIRIDSRLALCVLLGAGASTPAARQALPVVVVETEKGTIEIEVNVRQAPVTSANFLKYVDGGFYDGGQFHRTVRPDTEPRKDYPIQVVQASRARRPGGPAGFPAIALERTSTTGLRHLDGVVSMARGAADTATSDFFICIGDQPELDFGGRRNADGQGFAAFGRVVKGQDVVRAIQGAPVAAAPAGRDGAPPPLALSQTLAPPIRIVSARRRAG
jgi:peptidyl-prolyl cis-trans isomerase A (cyclophilin A)